MNAFAPQTRLRHARLEADQHIQRLIWRHGIDRALMIVAGLDEDTKRDIAKWRNLGGGK